MKILIFLLSLAVVLGFSSVPKISASEMTAEAILQKVIEQYSTCDTYRDTGRVQDVTIYDDRRESTIIKFSTRYSNDPKRFRFEFKRTHHEGYEYHGAHHIIWAEDDKVYTWWDVATETKKKDSLQMAIASATGVSAGSARQIPGLLVLDAPILAGWDPRQMKNLARLPDDAIESLDCFQVQGEFGATQIVLWISKGEFLIHKIEKRYSMRAEDFPGLEEDFRGKTTMVYQPAINQEISDEDFEFAYPNE